MTFNVDLDVETLKAIGTVIYVITSYIRMSSLTRYGAIGLRQYKRQHGDAAEPQATAAFGGLYVACILAPVAYPAYMTTWGIKRLALGRG